MAEVRTLAPTLLALDCEKCGAPLPADLDFDNSTCDQCGHVLAETTAGKSLLELIEQARQSRSGGGWRRSAFQCSECGAKVVVPVNDKQTSCVFCGSTHIGTLQGESYGEAPDYVACALLTPEESIEQVLTFLRGGRKVYRLTRIPRRMVKRLLRQGKAHSVKPVLVPIYRLTFKVQLRGKTLGGADVPSLAALRGVYALGSRVCGNVEDRGVVHMLSPGGRLERWESDRHDLFEVADVSPKEALAALRPRLPRMLARALNRYFDRNSRRSRVGKVMERIVGIEYEVIAVPVHIVEVSAGRVSHRFIVNATNGDMVGPPQSLLFPLPPRHEILLHHQELLAAHDWQLLGGDVHSNFIIIAFIAGVLGLLSFVTAVAPFTDPDSWLRTMFILVGLVLIAVSGVSFTIARIWRPTHR